MPVEILMPKLGLTMEEGLLVEWTKAEGDQVAAGEVVFILETEKVTYEVESPADGILGRIIVAAGDTVPVGAVVGYLLGAGESADDIPLEAAAPAPEASAEEAPAEAAPEPAAPAASGARVRATPLAKKLAREAGIDLSTVTGSGSSGRVVAEDVRQAQAAGPQAAPAATTVEAEPKLVPHSGMRRAIAKNMMASKTQTAQTYMSVTADATAISEMRQELLPLVEESHGVRLTITDLFMKATAGAIAQHPIINTRWSDEGVWFLPEVHMGMAMALDEGLIVAVIRDINRKSLGQVAQDRVELISKGREGRFLPDDIKGSTFTLSAMGMFGIESFTTNINAHENGILAVGAIIKKPVVNEDDQIVVRPMVNLTLTYDHRTIDGAEAGKFMRTLKSFVEHPARLLV